MQDQTDWLTTVLHVYIWVLCFDWGREELKDGVSAGDRDMMNDIRIRDI